MPPFCVGCKVGKLSPVSCEPHAARLAAGCGHYGGGGGNRSFFVCHRLQMAGIVRWSSNSSKLVRRRLFEFFLGASFCGPFIDPLDVWILLKYCNCVESPNVRQSRIFSARLCMGCSFRSGSPVVVWWKCCGSFGLHISRLCAICLMLFLDCTNVSCCF